MKLLCCSNSNILKCIMNAIQPTDIIVIESNNWFIKTKHNTLHKLFLIKEIDCTYIYVDK